MSLLSRSTARLRPLLCQRGPSPSVVARALISTKKPTPPAPTEPSHDQSMPLGAYYEAILNTPQPIPDEKPEEPPSSSIPKQKEKAAAVDKEKSAEKDDGAPSAPPSAPASKTPKTKPGRKKKDDSGVSAAASSVAAAVAAAAQEARPSHVPGAASEKSRIAFSSSLVGPAERAERLAELRRRSSLVAGVLVPPRPDEPDNCCMSGCVNCVWDRYREDMEAWSGARAEADRRLAAQKAEAGAIPLASNSMDEDGGGSERNWDVGPARIAKDLWDDELYRDLPVGIREFMRQEKRLKEKHEREGTVGS